MSAERTCAACGQVGPASEFVISPLRGKAFCQNDLECDERAAARGKVERPRNPRPDWSPSMPLEHQS